LTGTQFYVASVTDLHPLDVIVDSQEQVEGVIDTSTGTPTGIMLELGDDNTVRIVPVPAGAYSIRLTAWVLPTLEESSSDAVPLLPSRYHSILVDGLAMDLAGFAIGEGTPRFLKFKAEYDKGIEDMAAARYGAQVKREFKHNDSDSAIQATI
jgi:hypothetical protein